MRSLFRVALAVALLGVAAVALAPAAWLDRPLAARTRGRIHLSDAEGMWWRGRGVLATSDGAARLPVAWRVAVPPLARGRIVVAFESRAGETMPSGTIDLGGPAIEASDFHAVVPAAFLSALAPALQTLHWFGNIDLRSPSFIWQGTHGAGALDARWQPARVTAGAFVLDLGTVTASSTPAGDGTLHNRGGDVTIDGTFTNRAGILAVSLTLTPTDRTPTAVRTMLPLFGAQNAAGSVTMTWQSAL